MDLNVVLPFLSSTLSFVFAAMVFDQWLRRRQPYQLVWSLGLLWYGISAGTEFLGSAFGWNEPLYRAWYLFGAFGVASYLGMGTIYLLNRTRFGRHIYAVGGNAEASRRAGIDVDRVKIACFALCSFMAVVGGIVLASRLRSVDTNTGGGQALLYPIAAAVIGGTSLFGGRGSAYSAMLGILVLQSIQSGLNVIGVGSPVRFMITGAVLLLAVAIDSVARRARSSSGRG